jgi:hypothetical protein
MLLRDRVQVGGIALIEPIKPGLPLLRLAIGEDLLEFIEKVRIEARRSSGCAGARSFARTAAAAGFPVRKKALSVARAELHAQVKPVFA